MWNIIYQIYYEENISEFIQILVYWARAQFSDLTLHEGGSVKLFTMYLLDYYIYSMLVLLKI